jgi:hypothetical protein
MAFKGELKKESKVVIVVEADVSNSKSTSLLSQTIPNVVGTKGTLIPPGLSRDIKYSKLPNAKQLHINVNLPEPGSGIVTVLQHDLVVDREVIQRDIHWVYAII